MYMLYHKKWYIINTSAQSTEHIANIEILMLELEVRFSLELTTTWANKYQICETYGASILITMCDIVNKVKSLNYKYDK